MSAEVSWAEGGRARWGVKTPTRGGVIWALGWGVRGWGGDCPGWWGARSPSQPAVEQEEGEGDGGFARASGARSAGGSGSRSRGS